MKIIRSKIINNYDINSYKCIHNALLRYSKDPNYIKNVIPAISKYDDTKLHKENKSNSTFNSQIIEIESWRNKK